MFHKKKKTNNKVYANNVSVYRYFTDTGLLEIYPQCLVYEQFSIVPKLYYARGTTRTIGLDNFIMVNKNPKEVLARYTQHDIVFWLEKRDDHEARKIIQTHLEDRINQIIIFSKESLAESRKMYDIMKKTFDGSIPDIGVSDQELEQYLEKYAYRLK